MKKRNTLVNGYVKDLLSFAAEEDSYTLGSFFFQTKKINDAEELEAEKVITNRMFFRRANICISKITICSCVSNGRLPPEMKIV